MRSTLPGVLVLVIALQGRAVAQPGGKVDIVSVTGCLRERGPDMWVLTAATEPVVSIANAPPAREIPRTPPDGRLTFRLIGVGEFKLPPMKDRTVVVKGLYIRDTPMPRINVTSVVEAVATCASGAPR